MTAPCVHGRHPERVLTGHTGRASSCAFSPDGTLLATISFDRTARLWHLPDGNPQDVLTGHTDAVTSCAFSPDSTLLATTSDDTTTRLWRVADGSEHRVLSGHTSWVEACAFSPDGTGRRCPGYGHLGPRCSFSGCFDNAARCLTTQMKVWPPGVGLGGIAACIRH